MFEWRLENHNIALKLHRAHPVSISSTSTLSAMVYRLPRLSGMSLSPTRAMGQYVRHLNHREQCISHETCVCFPLPHRYLLLVCDDCSSLLRHSSSDVSEIVVVVAYLATRACMFGDWEVPTRIWEFCRRCCGHSSSYWRTWHALQCRCSVV